MLRLAVLAFSLFAPIPVVAQSGSSEGLSESVRDLADILRKASRNEVYLIDEVAQTCKRITSGLKQRDTIYFKTSGNNQSSELFLDGEGTLRFNAVGGAANDCGISNEFSFRIRSAEDNTRTADYSSGYCISAIVFDNCSYTCNQYAEIGERRLLFVNGIPTANSVLSKIGGETCIE
jgi:hypothetical protein